MPVPEDTGVEPVETIVADEGAAPDLSSVKAHDDMGDTVRELYRKMGSPGNEGHEPVHRASTQDREPDGKFAKAAAEKAAADKAKVDADVAAKAAAKTAEDSASADGSVADESAVAKGESVTPDPAAEAAAAAAAEAAKKPAADVDKAPTSWKGPLQAKFAALDPEVRAEIHRREADFHKGLTDLKPLANVGKLLHAEIAPYAAMIAEYKLSPQQVIRDLFKTASTLRGGTQAQKIAIMRGMAHEYSIDLNSVVPTEQEIAAAAAAPQPDPQVPVLRQQLQETQDQIKQFRDSQLAELKAETEAFAQAPGHEHFEEVKAEMAALLESGTAKSLQEAYDNAIYTKPSVRAKVLAQQQETERKRAADKAAAAKRAASTNVKTRGSLPSTPVVKGTDMADTVRSVLRGINARAGAAS